MSARSYAFIAALALSLHGGVAVAGGSGGGIENRIKTTGVASFDEVFTEAARIDTILDDARVNLKSGRTNLAVALALPEGTPLKDSLTELRGMAVDKLELMKVGDRLQLQAKDGVPPTVNNAVVAVNSMLDGYLSSAQALASLPQQVQSLVQRASLLPQALQDPASLGLNVMDVPVVLKKTKNNVDMISNMPKRVQKLTTELQSNTQLVAKTLAPQKR